MQNTAKALNFFDLGDLQAFVKLVQPNGVSKHPQITYIHQYLHDLGVKTIIEEPNYFDRDYLAEFSMFYSLSANGYQNYPSSWEVTRRFYQE